MDDTIRSKRSISETLLDVWMTPPGTKGRVTNVLGSLLAILRAQGFLDDSEVESIVNEGAEAIRAAAELTRIHVDDPRAERISLCLFWVAACKGDRFSCQALIQALSRESASSEPRRSSEYLNHIVVRWVNFFDQQAHAQAATVQKDAHVVRDAPPAASKGRKSHYEFRMTPDGEPRITLRGAKGVKHYYPERGDKLPEDLVVPETPKEPARSLDEVRKRIAQNRVRAAQQQATVKRHESDNIIRALVETAQKEDEESKLTMVPEEAPFPWDAESSAMPARPQSRVVCNVIGDPLSRDGKDITQRYAHFIGQSLPFHGEIPEGAEFSTQFMDMFPWAENVGRYLAGQLSLLRNSGNDALTLPPLLLVGPPGSGKTKMLEWMAQSLKSKWHTVACGGVADSGGLAAVSRGWANTKVSAPVQAMIDLECANPVVILDEIDKGTNLDARNGSMMATLISMLQSKGTYYDNCLLAEVDISHVSFMATANDISKMPDALKDRFLIFRVPRPDERHFETIFRGVRRHEAERLNVREEMLPWLMAEDVEWLKNAFIQSNFSIRTLEQAHRLILGERAAEEMEMAQRPN